jgi:hypothetical protein
LLHFFLLKIINSLNHNITSPSIITMIRPLIVSLYDYRMTFMQESNEQLRNGYKMHFMEASAYLAADEVFSKIDQQGLDPE